MSGCWLGLEFALNIVKKGKSCQDNFSLRALSQQLPRCGAHGGLSVGLFGQQALCKS